MSIKLNSNIVSGIVFLILSLIILFIMPQQISVMQEGPVNAQTIPRLVTVIILVCSVLLLIQGLFFTEKKVVYFNKTALRNEFRGISMIAIFIGYGVIINLVGFLISSMLLSAACLMFFRVKNWRFYAVAFGIVLIIYYTFAVALNVNLP